MTKQAVPLRAAERMDAQGLFDDRLQSLPHSNSAMNRKFAGWETPLEMTLRGGSERALRRRFKPVRPR